ncbi:MAG: hypothetical protein Q8Q23_00535 [bacterium]|nr:hypothetical protein [bacterium]
MNKIWSEIGFVAHPTMESFFTVPDRIVNVGEEICPSFFTKIDDLHVIEEVFIEHILDFIVISGRAEDAGIPTELQLVLEGDWGGVTYVTVPVRLIGANASIKNISKLLKLLDAFDNGESEGTSWYTEDVARVTGEIYVLERFHTNWNDPSPESGGCHYCTGGVHRREDARVLGITAVITQLLDFNNPQKIDPGELFT